MLIEIACCRIELAYRTKERSVTEAASLVSRYHSFHIKVRIRLIIISMYWIDQSQGLFIKSVLFEIISAAKQPFSANILYS